MEKQTETFGSRFDGTDYAINNGCLNLVVKKKVDEKFLQFNVRLLNGWFRLEVEITHDNGADIEKSVEMTFLEMGGKKIAARVPVKDILNNNYLLPYSIDCRPVVGPRNKSLIVDSILAQAAQTPRVTIYQQTGWRKIGGKYAFLNAGGAIGANGITVELSGRNVNYFFTDSDSPGRYKTVKKFLDAAPRTITIPLLAFAFLSPLCEVFRRARIEPSFILMLLGVTGSMKSTLAALALNFFGEAWNNKNLPHSFKDTANALEKSLFLLADVLTVIDDLHPAGSKIEAARMAATFQAVSRSVGDRTGRQRMNADASLRQSYVPRSNVIITGEDFPDIGQSGTARNIIIELKKGDVDIPVLTDIQSHTAHLAESMRDFIKWLLPQYDKLPEVLKKHFLILRERAQGVGHGRTAEAIAHLQIGISIFLKFMCEVRAFTEAECDSIRNESWQIFIKLADEQNRRIQQDKPTILFLSALKELLDTKEYNIESIKRVHPYSNPPEDSLGFFDDDYIYLYPETAYKAIKQFYNAADRNFPLSKSQLFKHLQSEGLIEAGEDRSTKPKKIRGENKRLLWLKASALEVKNETGG